jgi:hypothetical protein
MSKSSFNNKYTASRARRSLLPWNAGVSHNVSDAGSECEAAKKVSQAARESQNDGGRAPISMDKWRGSLLRRDTDPINLSVTFSTCHERRTKPKVVSRMQVTDTAQKGRTMPKCWTLPGATLKRSAFIMASTSANGPSAKKPQIRMGSYFPKSNLFACQGMIYVRSVNWRVQEKLAHKKHTWHCHRWLGTAARTGRAGPRAPTQ